MSEIFPGQHWPTQQGDMYHAFVRKAVGRDGWCLTRTTPACTWFAYYAIEEEALHYLGEFFRHANLTPECRAEIAEAKRKRLRAERARIDRELEALG